MDDRYIRQQELVNQERLADLHVAVVGCGAVGSFVALSLCKMLKTCQTSFSVRRIWGKRRSWLVRISSRTLIAECRWRLYRGLSSSRSLKLILPSRRWTQWMFGKKSGHPQLVIAEFSYWSIRGWHRGYYKFIVSGLEIPQAPRNTIQLW
jgi:hypothetical protein